MLSDGTESGHHRAGPVLSVLRREF